MKGAVRLVPTDQAIKSLTTDWHAASGVLERASQQKKIRRADGKDFSLTPS